ncbi:amidase [Spongiactinospora sp. TRM90649]|uniref:amidase n=1 Tax=Spongiactinospora sp. TRM90649 TaxID=3031114 RepID=UPI0023F96DB3|nr:amidase [Spongiactinospora sp. TRM90649]MDF5751899.1 amidase [Spongiactinospora sp. TRM90649]
MSWLGHTAVEIAAAVRRGETTAHEVVAEHLAAISERAGLEAFRVVRQAALAEARAVQDRADLARLPLAGVPVAIKDNIAVAGEADRNGSAATPAAPAAADHPVVARLRAAGAVVVGVTNVPELCLAGFADSSYGMPRNPWNPARTAGGSSSGSAVAVAAGLVPIAHGTDGLGSLRIPAACCGLLTLKPGPGVVPPQARDWFGLAESGPLATTVADLSLALAVMADDMALATAWRTGGRTRMAWEPGPASGPLGSAAAWREEPFELRVAVAPAPLPPGFGIDPEFQAAVLEAGEILRVAGHTVVPHPGRFPMRLGPAALALWARAAADGAHGLDRALLERRTRALARAGRVLDALRLTGRAAYERWRAYGADRWFGDADVLITPTLALAPPPADRWGRRGLLPNVSIAARYAPVTGPWNLAGWPAMSVPLGTRGDGLPIGVQLVAPPGGEAHLLGLAAQIEQARPWPRHAP